MKKLVIFIAIVFSIVIGMLHFAHGYVSAYCARQKQITDSIAKVDSTTTANSINNASAVVKSFLPTTDTTILNQKTDENK